MQGNIDFSGTLSGSIAGGGGGGSDVTITPTLQSGTKIADYTIDETSGSLYAPTPPQSGVIDVQVNNSQVPDYESVVENSVAKLNLYPYMEKSETYILFDLLNDEIELVDGKVGALEQIVPYKQDKLTAGNNIYIDQDNVISATSSGGVNYSTTEQDTGLIWKDGVSHVYQKTIVWNGSLAKNQSATLDSTIKFSDLIYFSVIEKDFSCSSTASGTLFSNYYTNTVGGGNIEIAINDTVGIYLENYSNFYIRDLVLTIRYVKSV